MNEKELKHCSLYELQMMIGWRERKIRQLVMNTRTIEELIKNRSDELREIKKELHSRKGTVGRKSDE